jgi:DNA-binding IclR family transcriptional regulator
VSRSDEDVLRFIAASFTSVWALELLLVLRRGRRQWTQAELVAALTASELVVSRALDGLIAAGLASMESDGAHYLPVTAEVDACVIRAEQMYRSHPNIVRRAIIRASASSATAFADAFKLRKGRDD